MGSSYIWCNSTKVTLFLDRKFLRDLTIINSQYHDIINFFFFWLHQQNPLVIDHLFIFCLLLITFLQT